MKRPNAHHSLLAMLVASSILIVSSSAAQQRGLFAPIPSESTFLPSERDPFAPAEPRSRPSGDYRDRVVWLGGETVRQRSAYIDLEQLAATRAELGRDSTEAVALVLNLFPDTSLRATDMRVAPTPSGYSLSGRLEGFEFGTVTMAVGENVVAGSIRTGEATYTIRSIGEGMVEIRQVDPASLPSGAEPLIRSIPQAAGPLQAAATAQGGEETVIDVLIVWTPTAREEVGGTAEIETLIDLYVAEANQAYGDSGVSLSLNLLHSQEVDYVESEVLSADLYRLADEDGHLDEVTDLQDRVGADLVQLVRGASSDATCGIALQVWRSTTTDDGERSHLLTDGSNYSVISHRCHDGALAHEFGHNLGLAHDRYVAAELELKPYSYAHGYVNQRAFASGASESQRWLTIMAYTDQCGDSGFSCARVLRFSNPDQTHLDDPLGVAGEEETLSLDGPADARRSLNNARDLVAGFREERAALGLRTRVSAAGLQPGQDFSVEAEVRNRGRADSGATTLRFYRSTDAVISKADEELASVTLGDLEAGSAGRESIGITAPPDWGNHYYGVCVDSESAIQPCSAPVEVSVGPTVSIAPATATEGEDMAFPVALSSAQTEPVAVAWTVSPVTAVASVDYAAAGATETSRLVIPAGDDRAFISIPTLDDDVAEPEDVLAVALSHAAIGDGRPFPLSVDARSAAGTIADNDGDLSIPDPGLRVALRIALGKDPEEAIEVSDLAALRELDWSLAKRKRETGSGWSHQISDLTGLEFAPGLRRIDLTDNDVTDLSPLAHAPNIRELRVGGEISVSDVRPLAALRKLRLLQVSHGRVQDISGLGGLVELRELDLRFNEISDISALAGLTNLELLSLDKNPVSDLSPLAGLTRLERLWMRYAMVSDVSPLANLGRLGSLDLRGNLVADISPLKSSRFASGCYSGLNLSHNNLSDISALADFALLEALTLDGNAISDIGPLAGLHQLTDLFLADNAISDIGALAGLTRLQRLDLGENEVDDIGPLANLTQLWWLNLFDNAISDIRPLAGLEMLRNLDLGGNRITDISPLSGLESLSRLGLRDNAVFDIGALASVTRLGSLDLSANRVVDISPLASLRSLRTVYVLGNPLSPESRTIHAPALRSSGVGVLDIGLSVHDGSVKEGDADGYHFPVYLSAPVKETIHDTVVWFWYADAVGFGLNTNIEPTASLNDVAGLIQTRVTIPAGEVAAVTTGGRAAEDDVDEDHETFIVQIRSLGRGFPERVGLEGHHLLRGATRNAEAVGLVVDPSGPSHDVPLFPSAGEERRQGFARVVNRGRRSAAHVEAIDDGGTDDGAVTLTLPRGAAVNFNSDDLVGGNRDKGVHGGVGEGDGGDWRLKLWANDIDVLAYVRTPDGFLSSMHDTVPRGADGAYRVPIFNPGSNRDQVSLLRLANPGAEMATLAVTGVDDAGASPGGPVTLTLDAGASRTITAVELELGSDLDGALGDGRGKWRLAVTSDLPVVVASLLESPTGHLTNLSTVPDNKRSGEEGETIHDVPLFLSASDPHGREGFVRVVNRGDDDAVLRVKAHDETVRAYEAVQLEVGAGSAAHFNSHDLEQGNAAKGLSAGVGAGEGDWRLVISGEADVDVLAYVRTADGFLSSMHDTVRRVDGRHEVPIFNPGSNRNQASRLRLVNLNGEDAHVSVRGVDDLGVPRGMVELTVPAGGVRSIAAHEMEAGADGLSGALGDGEGKWRLVVESDHPVQVLSLLESPTGHLTNLSTVPGLGADPR